MKSESGSRERLESALIVEDDPTMASTLADAVTEAGYCPVVVRSIEEALAAMREDVPAVLLLDLGLEVGFGGDLLDALSNAADAPSVIVVSGFPLADMIADRFSVELVKKPFALETLFETLARARQRCSRPRRAG